ncbi:MAG: NemA, partial [Ilumatobacteraceae bacterium]|nr:NemA [Ilumatobacteraceae bacterium]
MPSPRFAVVSWLATVRLSGACAPSSKGGRVSDHELYPHVYRPLQIGPVEVKNRIYQTPHGSIALLAPPSLGLIQHVYGKDPADGSPVPHPHVIDYFEERARGGAGLLIQGHIEILKGDSGRYHLTTDTATDHFIPLLERVHAHGTKMFAQLHCGMRSPSGLPGAGHVGEGFPRPLDKHDIREIVRLIGVSTKNAIRAGYDGVELHAAHLHSVGMFLSGFTNHRTDEYGGSLENRMRIIFECLESMHENADGKLAIGIRMPCDEQLEGGIDGDEACEIVRRLEASGLVHYF